MTWQSRDALEAALGRLQVEAGGVMELYVVRPPDALGILADAIAGDAQAARIYRAVCTATNGIKTAPKKQPMLCASCPRPLRAGTPCSIILAVPRRDDAHQAVTLAVCAKCATQPKEIRQKALGALARIWPDARPIEITHDAGGRA